MAVEKPQDAAGRTWQPCTRLKGAQWSVGFIWRDEIWRDAKVAVLQMSLSVCMKTVKSGTREINSGGSTSWTKKCSRNAVVLGIGGFWRQRDTVLFNNGSIVPISKLAKDFPKGMLPRRVMVWSEAVDLILPHDFYEDYFHCLKRRRKTHAFKPNKNNTKLGTKIEILCWLRVGFGVVGSPFPLLYGRGYREIPTSRWLTR